MVPVERFHFSDVCDSVCRQAFTFGGYSSRPITGDDIISNRNEDLQQCVFLPCYPHV